jgi:hypothetical protein
MVLAGFYKASKPSGGKNPWQRHGRTRAKSVFGEALGLGLNSFSPVTIKHGWENINPHHTPCGDPSTTRLVCLHPEEFSSGCCNHFRLVQACRHQTELTGAQPDCSCTRFDFSVAFRDGHNL